MADTEIVREVELTTAEVARPRFTPRELRLIKDQTGRSFSRVMADDDSDDRFVVFAWLKLRRDGVELDFAEMDDVVISISSGEAAPDPMNGQPPTASPPSVATGA